MDFRRRIAELQKRGPKRPIGLCESNRGELQRQETALRKPAPVYSASARTGERQSSSRNPPGSQSSLRAPCRSTPRRFFRPSRGKIFRLFVYCRSDKSCSAPAARFLFLNN